jgi:hypothetical protein
MLPSGTSNLLLTALLVSAAIAVAKLFTAAMTGSGAVLAEFVHSIATTTSLALLLIATRRAVGAFDAPDKQRADGELHFWCLVAPILIYSLGAGVALSESIAWLQSPRQLAELPAGLAVLAAVLVAQTALAIVIRRHTHGAGDADRGLLQMLTGQSIAAVAGLGAALGGLAATYAFGTIESDAFAALTVGLVLGGVAAMMAAATRKHLRTMGRRTPVPAPPTEPAPSANDRPAAVSEDGPRPRHGKRKRR